MVPGLHGAGTTEPVTQKPPGGHATHPDALDRPLTLEYEPAGHDSRADAPSGQKLPAPQIWQAVAPSES